MASPEIVATGLPGVFRVTPPRFGDARGYFSEVWSRASLAESGLDLPAFVQDNVSLSRAAGTLRGLHFQTPPKAQGKLVRCGRGRLFDVAVDARRGSPSYGRWHGEELSAENGRQLWIPAGFLHGFLTLEPDTEAVYKVTAPYDAACDGAVRWDTCGIAWPLAGLDPVLSAKDAAAPAFADFISPFLWGAP